jgi:hypothetical protein
VSSLAGYETTAQAAARLGVGYRHIWRLAAAGRVEGAQLLTVGSRAFWYVPADMTLDDCRRYVGKKAPHAPRCDKCGIVLTRSGDDGHKENDAPDAGRCWDCRDRFGVGPLAAGGSIEGVCDEDLSEVSHAESMTLAAHSMSSQDSAPQ